MKNTTPRLKLAVNREAIRTLANVELVHVVGGETNDDKACPLRALAATAVTCPVTG